MSFSGLTEREAEAAKQKHGMNVHSYKYSFGSCLLGEFSSLAVRLLIISALIDVVSIMLGLLEVTPEFDSYPRLWGTVAAAVILAFAGAAVRFVSGKILHESLSSSPKGTYTVFRGIDKTTEISASEITVGDLIFVSEGDVIPADGTITDGTITAEQSALGLSAKTEKIAAPDGYRSGSVNLKDSYSVFCGSAVCSGNAVIRVTAVGDETQLAKRSADVYPEIPEETFSAEIKTAAVVGIVAAAAAIVSCTINGIFLGEALNGFVYGLSVGALALAAVCAGGKALMCEAIGAYFIKKLKRLGVSVTKAECLVNAGKTEILMTERAGMITEGKYSVSGFIDGNGKEYSSFSATGKHLGRLLKMAVKGTAKSEILSDGTVRGRNLSDNAMLGFVKGGGKRENLKKQTETSENGIYGVTVSIGNGLYTMIRGEPEAILRRCGEYLTPEGKRHKITNKSAIQQLTDATLLGGKDIVAFGFSDRGIKNGKIPASGFVMIGFMILQDGYLEESKESVKRLRKMGVRTMLITSGSRRNSIFTVKYAGIKKSGSVVIDSEQLRKMSSSELASRLEKTNAVAEASERDKIKLAAAAKFKGKRVCLAGSFTEDIPVLEEADTAFASSAAPPSVAAVCGASADGCGISSAAELISGSRDFVRGYKFWIIFRTAVALVVSVVFLFLGW